MDQPAIYSETLRERVIGVMCLACGVRHVGETGYWARDVQERLKTGATDLQREHRPRRAEFFALPIRRRA